MKQRNARCLSSMKLVLCLTILGLLGTLLLPPDRLVPGQGRSAAHRHDRGRYCLYRWHT